MPGNSPRASPLPNPLPVRRGEGEVACGRRLNQQLRDARVVPRRSRIHLSSLNGSLNRMARWEEKIFAFEASTGGD